MESCPPNIGPSQRRRRFAAGIVLGAATVFLAILLVTTTTSRQARALIAIPALGASLGFLQARARTCVALAARGVRNMDEGNERVDDPVTLSTMRAQARRVYLWALTATLVVTAAVMAM